MSDTVPVEDVIRADGWIPGWPSTYCWCLAAVLSRDTNPRYRVEYLWFNPEALKKWFQGPVGSTQPFGDNENIHFWRPLPQPPAYTPEPLGQEPVYGEPK
jgi:hypothetical protein